MKCSFHNRIILAHAFEISNRKSRGIFKNTSWNFLDNQVFEQAFLKLDIHWLTKGLEKNIEQIIKKIKQIIKKDQANNKIMMQ